MTMNNMVVWTRLQTVSIVAVLIGAIGMTGLTVKAQTKTFAQVAGQSSDWRCHPNRNRGQMACFNLADGRHMIVATSLK
jgi:hypothetical protein